MKKLIFIFLVSFSLLFTACQPETPENKIKTPENNIPQEEIVIEVDEIQELETISTIDDFNLSELEELDELDKQFADLENLDI